MNKIGWQSIDDCGHCRVAVYQTLSVFAAIEETESSNGETNSKILLSGVSLADIDYFLKKIYGFGVDSLVR